MRHILLGLLGVCFPMFFFSSCEERPPLSDGEMEELVQELLLTNQCAPYPAEDTIKYVNLYADIYFRRGVDSLRVDSAFRYYAVYPDRLDAILDRVIARMQREFDSLDVVRPEEMKLEELQPATEELE